MEKGKVSTNIYLRRIHNFSLGMNWLPCPIIPKRMWPGFKFKDKRAITLHEHQKIVAKMFANRGTGSLTVDGAMELVELWGAQ